ncbi:TIGR03790 family protein [Rugamonas sp.]|uniref:TIGR03790 family protein n=1 Tax=Rugamonas sp. TaxID=1926287 RepID=UPI0025DFE263|nr:TIGR03790 family protein [Rugamonas sp.]
MRSIPLLLCALALLTGGARAQSAHASTFPPAVQPAQVAVVVNDEEPASVEVGEFYLKARGVPAQNLIHVRIPNHPHKLDAAQFAQLKEQIDAHLPPYIQAVLMVWTAPYAVECNSITSAYSLGLDAGLCAKPCGPAKPSAYFNAAPGRLPSEYGLRLSMLLPVETVEAAKALIERGVLSGFRTPTASAYYLITSETARNSRAAYFPPSGMVRQKKLTIVNQHADSVEGVKDLMIYQTGMARVAKLETLQFAPGALADHLTSFGGDLLGDGQMSSLRWLEAGATASYGTVSEPCNYWQKFPNPPVLLRQYLSGTTAIEAYWKSVAWPEQGVFIGEPLAAPYRH